MATSDRQSDVVVITGGSAGLGRAIADRFVASGAKLALVARGIERLERARDELAARGARVGIFS
jgi:NADP-dependent 3-hydroxy acid dehydrogenase YdfG